MVEVSPTVETIKKRSVFAKQEVGIVTESVGSYLRPLGSNNAAGQAGADMLEENAKMMDSDRSLIAAQLDCCSEKCGRECEPDPQTRAAQEFSYHL